MLFGSISYLNLLPFQLFLKKYIRSNSAKMAFRYHRAVPSKINQALSKNRVNAAFISSINSPKFHCTDLGIIAEQNVYSVLVIPDKQGDDPASETSNRLAKVMGVKGKVLIGDAALKHYLDGGPGIDLANEWHKKTALPFVFARLCYNRFGNEIEKLACKFGSSKTKIPQYILKKEAKKRSITPQQLTWYLEHIHYQMDWRAKRSLKKFISLSKRI